MPERDPGPPPFGAAVPPPAADDAAAQPILAAAAALDPARVPDDSTDAASPAPVVAHVEAPSPDVVVPGESVALPGSHRGGFTRPPTAPVDVAEQIAAHDVPLPTTSTITVADVPPPTNLAALSLGTAVVALIVALVLGWGFPLGIAAVAMAVISIRRGFESRQVALWATALGALSLVYSAGWLIYAGVQSGVLG